MAQTVQDVMTPNAIRLPPDASALEAAKAMRDHDIGDVIVEQDEQVRGIVTDRDLVVRCLADGEEGLKRNLGSLCSQDLVTLGPDSSVDEAVQLMKDKAIRRIPIVKQGRALGVVSLGDLAVERDRESALGQVSDAPANN